MSGIDVLIAIRSEFPEARIIMLTTFEGDVEIQRALQAGARGYLLKNMPPTELLEVIRQVHAGKKRIPPEIASQLLEHMSDEVLTEREIEVLREVGRRQPKPRDRRATLHLRRDRQGPHQAHHGEAGRLRSHTGRRHRSAPRHHPTLATKKHRKSSPQKGT